MLYRKEGGRERERGGERVRAYFRTDRLRLTQSAELSPAKFSAETLF